MFNCHWSVKVSQELLRPLRPPKLAKCALLDLPDAFAGKVQIRADFGKSLWLAVSETEPAFDNGALLFVELSEYFLHTQNPIQLAPYRRTTSP